MILPVSGDNRGAEGPRSVHTAARELDAGQVGKGDR